MGYSNEELLKMATEGLGPKEQAMRDQQAAELRECATLTATYIKYLDEAGVPASMIPTLAEQFHSSLFPVRNHTHITSDGDEKD